MKIKRICETEWSLLSHSRSFFLFIKSLQCSETLQNYSLLKKTKLNCRILMVKSGPSALKKFKLALKSNQTTTTNNNNNTKISKRSLNQKRLVTENLFEKKFNNVKFDILNKKGASKADALRNPARPGRKRAVEFGRKRDALRLELENRKRVGLMVDKRIGEYDASMSAEDKMLLRYVHAASTSNQRAKRVGCEGEAL